MAFLLAQEFEVLWESVFFQELCEILKNLQVWHSAISGQ